MHSRRIECVKNVSKIIPLVSTMVRNSLNNTATNLRAMVFPISNHRQKLPRFGNQKKTLLYIRLGYIDDDGDSNQNASCAKCVESLDYVVTV